MKRLATPLAEQQSAPLQTEPASTWTVAEFSRVWRLSQATVRRYCRDGQLPPGFRAVRFGSGDRADWRIFMEPTSAGTDEVAQRRQSAA